MMAPISLLSQLKNLYSKKPDDRPIISTHTAAILSIFLTSLYVFPLYVSSSTRPTPSLSRDAPSVIRARMRTVALTSTISTLFVLWFIVDKSHASILEALKFLGWWPLGISEILRCQLLTSLLFTGPLFEKWAAGAWREETEKLGGWIGWRNYIAGPVTEEIVFRSAIVPLHLLAKVSPGRIVFFVPLYFGIAHVHHFYEFRVTHPGTSVAVSLIRSMFQLSYTTIFGWYATFLYLRTGSILAVIIAHSFCNYCGLPRLWGRLDVPIYSGPPSTRGKEDGEWKLSVVGYGKSGSVLTLVYYTLLFGGAIAFYFQLWSLTESSHELASFTSPSP